VSWTVETLNETVDSEVEALPEDMRARLARITMLTEEKGLERVGEPHVKHVEGRLWEMRLTVPSGISPALYVTAVGQRVVIVRVFAKKTEKTPRREIELALSRAKSVGGVAMARISDLHKKWLKEPKYRKAYEALEEEFVLASAVMDVRNRAGLTQEELARKMGTTQPVVARLESGRGRPSMRTLERLAEATGSRLLIKFEPRNAKRPAG
jgi:phage-related protein/DNA-binding XRE family transcriptional regulator